MVFVVFSEIYYKPGWNAYVDGEMVDYYRVNYVLRGMRIPEGNHSIEFVYEPFSVKEGKIIIIISTLLMLAFLGYTLFNEIRK